MSKIQYLDPYPLGDPVILLIHGLGATSVSWSFQLEYFGNAGYRPIAVDVPGFGRSIYDGKGWSIRKMAAECAGFLMEIGCPHAHVIGLSMGGVISQQLAFDYPELVRTLILVSTFACFRPDSASGWVYFFRRMLAVMLFGLNRQARIVAQRVFPGTEQDFLRQFLVDTIINADRRAYRKAMLSMARFDSRKPLGALRIPTLVVTGSLDTTISPRQQKRMVDGIWGAKHVTIDGANHAVPIDRADQFNQQVIQFMMER